MMATIDEQHLLKAFIGIGIAQNAGERLRVKYPTRVADDTWQNRLPQDALSTSQRLLLSEVRCRSTLDFGAHCTVFIVMPPLLPIEFFCRWAGVGMALVLLDIVPYRDPTWVVSTPAGLVTLAGLVAVVFGIWLWRRR